MYFAGVIISCIIFGACFSKYYCCVLLFCQSKMKIRWNSRFISLHRNFLKTFLFLINKTMKSNMTKRCAKYDAANYENKKTQFYKLSYNIKYTKAIKKLTKICGLFRKEAETKSFFISFSESILNYQLKQPVFRKIFLKNIILTTLANLVFIFKLILVRIFGKTKSQIFLNS